VNSKDENVKTFVLIASKNSAFVLLILPNFVMQPVYVAKSNNPASLGDTKYCYFSKFLKGKILKSENRAKKLSTLMLVETGERRCVG
jgi:hypothetical protein